jgi:hypothetical protein
MAMVPDYFSRPITQELLLRITSVRFRRWVDDWINSGVDSSGLEKPSSRSFSSMTVPVPATGLAHVSVLAALENYVAFRLVFSEQDNTFTALIGEAKRQPGADHDPIEKAWDEDPVSLLVQLLVSDWGNRISKCRYPPCGRYFLLEKPRSGGYRHGTFCCKEHRAQHSAAARTKELRSQAKKRLIDLAARWLLRNSPDQDWQRENALKRRLAASLSLQIGQQPNLSTTRDEVKVNWVTRNAAKIEQLRSKLARSR